MSKTKKGSNAQFTSAGKGLTVIGEHCYAYSGSVLATPLASGLGQTTLLDFNTGKAYMFVKLQPTYFTIGTGEDIYYGMYINGIQIRNEELNSSTAGTPYDEINLIIPPLSHFEVKSYPASADRNVGITLTGRVYG